MEIFMLLVIVALLVMFQTSISSKLSKIEDELLKLKEAQRKLEKLFSPSTVREVQKETPVQQKTSVVPAPVKPNVTEEIKKPVAETPKPVQPLPPVFTAIPPPRPLPTPPTSRPAMQQKRPVPVQEDSWYESFRKRNPDLEKFIGENILSKIAITILVLGIGFFVKYAIDQNWINEIARVGIGILSGGIVMGFAHRLRKNFAAFSSVLVAGAIAIFYFSIGIGFHQYHLFSQTVAFILMLSITAFAVFIAILYDRMELAILSLIGGFAVPFMVSTGQGNYQVLFIYILILDAGMLVLAFFKRWNLVNILSYAFTIILYAAWLENKVINVPSAPYGGALFFGGCFYLLFLVTNMINSLKSERRFDRLEISILLSNTFLFYLFGMQILTHYQPQFQGLFSISMAIVNLITAFVLYKRFKADRRIVYTLIGMTLTFVTIAGPVQLEGNYITIFYALESLLLLWLAQKSDMVLYRFSSVPIMVFSSLTLLNVWMQTYFLQDQSQHALFINKGFLTGIFCAAALMVQQFLLLRELKSSGNISLSFSYLGVNHQVNSYRLLLKVLSIVILYLTGIQELNYQLKQVIPTDNAIVIVLASYHLVALIVLNRLYHKTQHQQLRRSLLYASAISLGFYVAVIVWLGLADFNDNALNLHRNPTGFIFHYLALVAALLLAYFTRQLQQKDGLKLSSNPHVLPALAMVSGVYISSVEVLLHAYWLAVPALDLTDNSAVASRLFSSINLTRQSVIKVGFPILWGLLSFIMLTMGMKRNMRDLRIGALLLIALTLVKLFTYDISNASEAGKIVAFIILGIVLLIISFLYQKIKALVVNREESDNEKSAL